MQGLGLGLGPGQPDLGSLDPLGQGGLPGVGCGWEHHPRIRRDLKGLLEMAAVHGQVHGVAARGHPEAIGVGIAVGQLGRKATVQRPHEAVHAGRRGEDAGAGDPFRRGVRGGGIHRGRCVCAGISADQVAGGVADLQGDRLTGRGGQGVIDPGAEGRVRGRGLVLGQGRPREGGGAEPEGLGGPEQPRFQGGFPGLQLAQGTDPIEDPEASSMRGDDQVVAMDHQVAHGDRREVELERLPVVPVVEGDVHAEFGGRVQQAASGRILPDGVDEVAIAQAGDDGLPVPAPVAGAVELGLAILDPVPIHGDVGGSGVEGGGLDAGDLGPGRDTGGRDLGPVGAAIGAAPDKAVVRAHPQESFVPGRGGDGVDHAAAGLRAGVRGHAGGLETGRRTGVLAGEIRADHSPVGAAIGGAEQLLVAEVEGLGAAPREGEGQGPGAAVEVRHGQGRIHRAGLLGAQIQAVHGASVDDRGIVGVGGDHAGFAAHRDLPHLSGTEGAVKGGEGGQAQGPRVLLGAVDAVGEAGVRRHVVDLGRGLVQAGAPGPTAVEGDLRALVRGEDLPFRGRRVDPEVVEIVAREVAALGDEVVSAVVRAQQDGVGDVDAVGVRGIHREASEVPSPGPDAAVRAGPRPVGTRVIRAVESAFGAVQQGIHAAGLAGGYGQADAAALGREATALDLGPVVAAVGGLPQPRAWPLQRGVDAPGRAPGLPQGRVDHLGVSGFEGQVDGAGGVVGPQHLLPASTAVGGAEHAPLGIGAVGMAQGGHEDAVRTARIDEDPPDLLGVGQADVSPGTAPVGGAVHPVALGDVGAHVGLTGADVDDVRV